MSKQMCLNCGERPAVAPKDGSTVALCGLCAPKASGSRGVKMTPKKPPAKLKVLNGGRD